MIYNVTIKEIIVHEFIVESTDLKHAYILAVKKINGKRLKTKVIRKFLELDTIKQGKQNELNIKQKRSLHERSD